MRLSATNINRFLLFKLPSAFLSGVRVQELTKTYCRVKVRHRWINQNPFGSMYFAVQAMAAELSTGALVMQAIRESKADVSMLVARNEAIFHKKAKGLLVFECDNGSDISEAIGQAIAQKQGQVCAMRSVGKDASGAVVCEMVFYWTVKARAAS